MILFPFKKAAGNPEAGLLGAVQTLIPLRSGGGGETLKFVCFLKGSRPGGGIKADFIDVVGGIGIVQDFPTVRGMNVPVGNIFAVVFRTVGENGLNGVVVADHIHDALDGMNPILDKRSRLVQGIGSGVDLLLCLPPGKAVAVNQGQGGQRDQKHQAGDRKNPESKAL